MMNELAEVYYL